MMAGGSGDINIGNNQTNYGGSSGPQNVYNVRENNGGTEVLKGLHFYFYFDFEQFKE